MIENLIVIMTLVVPSAWCWGCSGQAIDNERRQLLRLLDPLRGYGFIMQDQVKQNEFTVHLCNNPYSQAAVWQSNLINTTDKHQIVLGLQNDTRVVKGSDHMIVTFGSGDKYTSGLCKGNSRSAMIILTCLPGKLHGNVRHVKESVGRHESNCYYLFEFETSVVCSQQPGSFWSSSTVLCFGGAVTLTLAVIGAIFVVLRCLPNSLAAIDDKIRSAYRRVINLLLPEHDCDQTFGTTYNRFQSTATISNINEET